MVCLTRIVAKRFNFLKEICKMCPLLLMVPLVSKLLVTNTVNFLNGINQCAEVGITNMYYDVSVLSQVSVF